MVIVIVFYNQFDIEKSITALASFASCFSTIFLNFLDIYKPAISFIAMQLQVTAICLQLDVM